MSSEIRPVYDRTADFDLLASGSNTEMRPRPTGNAIVHHVELDPETPFLQKPFTIEALLGRVREVLDAAKHP